ncbi:MAG: peptidase M15, partial [Mesorhizobium sp.]
PLPTWRPERSLPADLAPPPSKDVLMALAETADQGKTATDAFSVVPTARPEPTKPDAVKAVLDEANAQVGTADEYQVASLSEEPRSAFNDPSGVDAASPRQAVAARPAGSDPAAAIGAGVKTTRKEARATARDQKPGPRAVVVAAAPQAARWALTSGENVATVSSATTAPGYAYSIVHTPPSEVYTAGFQPSNQMADASRFTGNAVKFMSVARFQTK